MKLDIIDGHQFIYNGIQYRFRERRNNQLDWVCPMTREWMRSHTSVTRVIHERPR